MNFRDKLVPAGLIGDNGRFIAYCLLSLTCVACSPQVSAEPSQPADYIQWNAHLIFPVGSKRAQSINFEHPVQHNGAEWKDILESLQVRPKGGFIFWANNDAEQAFRPSEVNFLSAQLPTLFQQAGQHEWIAFYLQSPHSTGVTEVTSGAFFVEDGRLHLYLAHFRHLVTINERLAEMKRFPLNATGAMPYKLISNRTWTALAESEWSFSKPPMARAAEAVSVQAVESLGKSLEERLRKLKELRDQNLINDEQYKHKTEEILQGL